MRAACKQKPVRRMILNNKIIQLKTIKKRNSTHPIRTFFALSEFYFRDLCIGERSLESFGDTFSSRKRYRNNKTHRYHKIREKNIRKNRIPKTHKLNVEYRTLNIEYRSVTASDV